MLAENSNEQRPSSTTELGLKNAKLGIEETGEVNSKQLETPLLPNDNPLDAKQGVDGSTRKGENDDLQVNVGDWVSHILGDPVPKLMS